MASLDRFNVIHCSPEIVVVDKPPDVAMDGLRDDPDEITVERWVARALREYLQEPLPENASTAPGGGKPLIRDKSLKFVHQLDYATSGVLVLAFSKDMASALAHCFEFRHTRKEYVALVHGWVPSERLELQPSSAERDEAAGFDKTLSIASTVTCSSRRFQKTVSLQAAEGSLGGTVLSWPIGPDPSDPSGFRMMARDEAVKETATADSDDTPTLEALTVLSVLSRGYLVDPSDGTSSTTSPSPPTKQHRREDGDLHDERKKCTLVLLRLYTGRRHQLRCHCSKFGHPIIGDVTYEALHAGGIAAPSGSGSHESKRGTQPGAPSRMMLHALRIQLGIDLPQMYAMSPKERQAAKRLRRKETIGTAGSQAVDFDRAAVFEAPNRLQEFFQPSMV